MQLSNCLGKYHFSSDIRNFISHITYYSLMFFIAYAFKGQVHAFAGRKKIVSHSSCRTSAILKYFCPLQMISASKDNSQVAWSGSKLFDTHSGGIFKKVDFEINQQTTKKHAKNKPACKALMRVIIKDTQSEAAAKSLITELYLRLLGYNAP